MVTSGLVWSVVLAVVGIAGLWLAGSQRRAGWAVGLAAQVLWVVFAVTTGQYGFILSALAYGTVYGRNWWRWSARRHDRQLREAALTAVRRARSEGRIPRGHYPEGYVPMAQREEP